MVNRIEQWCRNIILKTDKSGGDNSKITSAKKKEMSRNKVSADTKGRQSLPKAQKSLPTVEGDKNNSSVKGKRGGTAKQKTGVAAKRKQHTGAAIEEQSERRSKVFSAGSLYGVCTGKTGSLYVICTCRTGMHILVEGVVCVCVCVCV
jgi:hypothetical protein